MDTTKLQGKVKFFNTEKGYGFISDLTKDQDYFFHVSNLLEDVVKDDVVEFGLETNKKGQKAVNVKKV